MQVSTSEAMVAQFSAPASCPANKAFFRFSAIGRMVRSTLLFVDLDAAVGEKEAKAVPVFADVGQNLAAWGLGRDARTRRPS